MNCSQIYIGVNAPLQQVEDDIFSVEHISESDKEHSKLNAVLNAKYIYYLAPHTGCGCGCGCGWEVLNTETESDNLSKKSLDALKHYLWNLSVEQSIYLLVCNQNFIRCIPAPALEVGVLSFISALDELRPKFGESNARLYSLKSYIP